MSEQDPTPTADDIHAASRAMSAVAKLRPKQKAAEEAALERVRKRFDAKRDAILEELSEGALAVVKRAVRDL